jgi:probable F420-dependent oxidoreductase
MPTKLPIQLSMRLKCYTSDDAEDWSQTLAAARAADQAGVDRLTVSDHVVYGERLEEYAKPELGGQKNGKQPTGPDGNWLEPLTMLSFVAAQTSKVRLGTNILLAALRRPVVLAKTLATMDVLSNGRLDIGVGVGWQREEYDAAGLKFEGRGRLLDHTLEVIQTLWREKRASYNAPELKFEAIHQMPKPRQAGGVPIWVSGTINKNTVSRLARFGAGWIPWGPDAADLVNSLPRMKDAVAKLGRKDLDTLQVVGNLPKDQEGGIDRAKVRALIDVGVTDFRTDFPASADKLPAMVGAFRAAVGK